MTTYTPPVTRAMFRRTAIMAGVVAAVAVVVLVVLGYGLWGLFLAVGVALGTLNLWLAVRSVANFATARPSKARLSGSVLARLALFQFLAIVSSMLPLIKEIRQK